jgi:hypothetical protein
MLKMCLNGGSMRRYGRTVNLYPPKAEATTLHRTLSLPEHWLAPFVAEVHTQTNGTIIISERLAWYRIEPCAGNLGELEEIPRPWPQRPEGTQVGAFIRDNSGVLRFERSDGAPR